MNKENEDIANLDETETESEDLDPPSEFICGLTMEIMDDPLMSRYGHNYERAAIVEWLARGNDTCPMTRRPMRLSDLISNHCLRTRIHQWKAEHQDDTNQFILEVTTSVPQCFGIIEVASQEPLRRHHSYVVHTHSRRRRREHARRSSATQQNAAAATRQPAVSSSESSGRPHQGSSARFLKRFFSRRVPPHARVKPCDVNIRDFGPV